MFEKWSSQLEIFQMFETTGLSTGSALASTDNDMIYNNLVQNMQLNKQQREALEIKRRELLAEKIDIDGRMKRFEVVRRLKDPTQSDLQFLIDFNRDDVK